MEFSFLIIIMFINLLEELQAARAETLKGLKVARTETLQVERTARNERAQALADVASTVIATEVDQ